MISWMYSFVELSRVAMPEYKRWCDDGRVIWPLESPVVRHAKEHVSAAAESARLRMNTFRWRRFF